MNGCRSQPAIRRPTRTFFPAGQPSTTSHFQAVKRIGKDFELNGNFAFEHWSAPIYNTGTPVYPAPVHTVTTTTIQLTWFPKQKLSF